MRVLGFDLRLRPWSSGTFGFELRRVPRRTKTSSWITDTSAFGRGWTRVLEWFPGAWQRNLELRAENVLTFAAVYSCVTLIAQDIAKLCLDLVQLDNDGIWQPTYNAAFSPVLRKPNHYQTRIKFLEQWVISKLVWGNAYVLKERDNRGVVVGLYVLNPQCVRPFVSPDGSVFYQLSPDYLSGVTTAATMVPASEIIHDVMVPLYHPLCGVSPITACGLAAVHGLQIQTNSAKFFANGLQPSGILTAPGEINDEQAAVMQERWMAQYTGDKVGKVAVLGNGLEYKPMSISAVDAQLIDQLKWTAENVCTAFHVPPYKVGVAPPPPNATVEALNLEYYSQCLQNPMESIEALLDEGLGLSRDGQKQTMGTEFDLDDLLKMDTASKTKAASEAIGSGGMSPNEARFRFFDLGPVAGGDSPYLQQQNYSLEALAKRDARPDPFAPTPKPTPAPVATPPDASPAKALSLVEIRRDVLASLRKVA